MEIRKIQRTGGSSFAISLPKEWVHTNSLKEGDSVALEALSSGELLVFPFGKEPYFGEYSLEIEGDVNPEHVLRTLIAIYLKGYDGILIKSEPMITEKLREAVTNFTTQVIGVEVMEETRDAITLKDLMGSPEIEPLKILLRMSSMVSAGIRDVESCLENPRPPLLKEVVERDSQIDKLYLLLDREFNKAIRYPLYAERLGVDLRGLWATRNASKQIERIGDHVESTANLLLQYGRPLTAKGLRELFDEALDTFERAFDAYTKEDVQASQELIDQVERASAEVSSLLQSYETGGTVYALLLAEDLVRIMFYSADIAEGAIDLGIKRAKRSKSRGLSKETYIVYVENTYLAGNDVTRHAKEILGGCGFGACYSGGRPRLALLRKFGSEGNAY